MCPDAGRVPAEEGVYGSSETWREESRGERVKGKGWAHSVEEMSDEPLLLGLFRPVGRGGDFHRGLGAD